MKNLIIGLIIGLAIPCLAFETSTDLTLKSEMYFFSSIKQFLAAVKIQKVKFTNKQAIACWNEAIKDYKAGFDENEKAIKVNQEEKKAWKDIAEELSK